MASLPPLPGSGKLKSTLIDADNPFRLPGDDHVFRMREEEVLNYYIVLYSNLIVIIFINLEKIKRTREGRNEEFIIMGKIEKRCEKPN